MKLKVLCFHPALAPYRVDFFNALSGVFDFHLVLLNSNLLSQKFNQKRLLSKLHCRVSYLLKGILWRGRYIRFGIIKLLRREHPTVVISYEYSPTTCYLTLLRSLFFFNFRLYTTTDDNVEMFENCRGVRAALRRYVLRRIDGIVVVDRGITPLAHRIAPRLKIIEVPIIYDEVTFREEQKKIFQFSLRWRTKFLNNGERAALFVGRLVSAKNPLWLINVVADMRWPKDLKLFIVGSGPLELKIRNLIKELKLDEHIILLGRIEGEQLQTVFAACDVLILPSTFEPFGAVVAEALHWGAPVLISTHVGAKVLVEDETCGKVFGLEDIDVFFVNLLDTIRIAKSWKPLRNSLLKKKLGNYISILKEVICE